MAKYLSIPDYYTVQDGSTWFRVRDHPDLVEYFRSAGVVHYQLMHKNTVAQKFSNARISLKGRRKDIHALYWGEHSRQRKTDIRWDCMNGFTKGDPTK